MCIRTESQSSVSPEQLLREILCRPQECGCVKGITRLSQALTLQEGWGGKEVEKVKGHALLGTLERGAAGPAGVAPG